MSFYIDEIDNQILNILIENTRTPYTEIAKRLIISAGTVHVRVKKMEEAGIIIGSSLRIDYSKMNFNFISYVGIYLSKSSQTPYVIESLRSIPFITEAHITAGKYNIFCQVRAIDTRHAKEVIFMIDQIEGVNRTETMISLEESFNDKSRLMRSIFKV